MPYGLLADLIVVLHATFVIFVLFGAILAWKRSWIVRLHLPAAAWGVMVEFTGWVCPLTPLENWLREQSGRSGYQTDFIGHYLLPILYPDGLTREMQFMLGSIVLLVNGAMYALLWRRWKTPSPGGR